MHGNQTSKGYPYEWWLSDDRALMVLYARRCYTNTFSKRRATYTNTPFDVCSKIENRTHPWLQHKKTRSRAGHIWNWCVRNECELWIRTKAGMFGHMGKPLYLLSSQPNQPLFALDEYESSDRWILFILVNRIEKCSLTQIIFFGPRIGLDRVWTPQ